MRRPSSRRSPVRESLLLPSRANWWLFERGEKKTKQKRREKRTVIVSLARALVHVHLITTWGRGRERGGRGGVAPLRRAVQLSLKNAKCSYIRRSLVSGLNGGASRRGVGEGSAEKLSIVASLSLSIPRSVARDVNFARNRAFSLSAPAARPTSILLGGSVPETGLGARLCCRARANFSASPGPEKEKRRAPRSSSITRAYRSPPLPLRASLLSSHTSLNIVIRLAPRSRFTTDYGRSIVRSPAKDIIRLDSLYRF